MPADLTLARDLVAAPQWRWRPGMRLLEYGHFPARIAWTDDVHVHASYQPKGGAEGGWLRLTRASLAAPTTAWTLDLDDGATAGCLLDMLPGLRRVVRDERETGPIWRVLFVVPTDGRMHSTLLCASLGEAAARALLAVWRQS